VQGEQTVEELKKTVTNLTRQNAALEREMEKRGRMIEHLTQHENALRQAFAAEKTAYVRQLSALEHEIEKRGRMIEHLSSEIRAGPSSTASSSTTAGSSSSVPPRFQITEEEYQAIRTLMIGEDPNAKAALEAFPGIRLLIQAFMRATRPLTQQQQQQSSTAAAAATSASFASPSRAPPLSASKLGPPRRVVATVDASTDTGADDEQKGKEEEEAEEEEEEQRDKAGQQQPEKKDRAVSPESSGSATAAAASSSSSASAYQLQLPFRFASKLGLTLADILPGELAVYRPDFEAVRLSHIDVLLALDESEWATALLLVQREHQQRTGNTMPEGHKTMIIAILRWVKTKLANLALSRSDEPPSIASLAAEHRRQQQGAAEEEEEQIESERDQDASRASLDVSTVSQLSQASSVSAAAASTANTEQKARQAKSETVIETFALTVALMEQRGMITKAEGRELLRRAEQQDPVIMAAMIAYDVGDLDEVGLNGMELDPSGGFDF